MNVIASRKRSKSKSLWISNTVLNFPLFPVFRFSDVLYFHLLVVKKPAKTAKIVGKGPAEKSKSGIFIHCLYLKCMQTSDWTGKVAFCSDLTSSWQVYFCSVAIFTYHAREITLKFWHSQYCQYTKSGACLLFWLIRLIALIYNLRAVNLLKHQ